MAERESEIFGIDRKKALLSVVLGLVLVGAEGAALLSFPAGDSGALRERLASLLALPVDRRRELGLAARRAVEERWSWPVVAARLLG